MKKLILVFTAAALIFSACGSSVEKTTEVATEMSTEITTEAQTFAPISVTTEAPEDKTVDLADLPIDPAYDFDIDAMEPSDFGDFFWNDYEVTVSTYKILPGDSLENEVMVIDSGKPGKTIYIIAGIHGDEEAAWRTGNLLKKISIKSGKIYILSPANKTGAINLKRTIEGKDPNRAFPGNPEGTAAQRYAYGVFNDVKDKNPDFVFDLHEARIVSDSQDYLGSSIVYSDMNLFGDLIIDIVMASQEGEICNRAFNFYSPGPKGSINKTITNELNIATMTIETFRGFQMEDRIFDQLSVIQYVLQNFGMVD